jgi:hypothetical protein
MTSIGF